MGSCFSSEKPDHRLVGSGSTASRMEPSRSSKATAPNLSIPLSTVPASAGHTMGGSADSSAKDPRQAAAEAAEARLQSGSKGGKLSSKLQLERAKNRTDLLRQEERVSEPLVYD